MTTKPIKDPSDRVLMRKLTDNPGQYPISLGCPTCPHFSECGGLSLEAGIFDCLSLCCGNPSGCTLVCRNKASSYPDQLREISGFDFQTVPRTAPVPFAVTADIVPLVYHGSSRARALSHPTLALRLADLINYRSGELRFETREALCAAFRVDASSTLILTAIDHDKRIEPWWALGDHRLEIIRGLHKIGIELVTAPNFSIFADRPRTDNLHAMNRVALSFAEFQANGIACALHPHGRTARDFERWAEFVREREEINVLAYEFRTGPATNARINFHLESLIGISLTTDRPLDIVVRGKPEVIPLLRDHFRKVIYLDSGAFMKSIKRQRAERVGNLELSWVPAPTEFGTPIDELFRHNAQEQIEYIRSRYYADRGPDSLTKAA